MNRFQNQFAQCLDLFSSETDKSGSSLSMFSFAADNGKERVNHIFEAEDVFVDLRSVSKVVVGLVLGVLIDRKTKIGEVLLNLDTCVTPFLERYMDDSARQQWRDVRVVDLLNNTIGHDEGFLFRKDLGDLPENDYLGYVFDTPIDHLPGHHFSYSNVGPFLFSVIIQDWIGMSLHEIAREAILDPMDIKSSWRCFGEYTAGSTGLSMNNSDLLKIACLLRDGGVYDGHSIVEKSWIDEMSLPRTLTPKMFDPKRVFPKYAYGIGLWVCEQGAFYCDGTNGQYLIVIPKIGMAITTTGDQPDMKPITRCMIPLTEF